MLFLAIVLAGVMLYSCQKEEIPEMEDQTSPGLVTFSSQVIEGKFIVLFEDEGLLKSASSGNEAGPEAVLQTTRDIFALMKMPAREPEQVYSSALRGIAVAMTNSEAMKMAGAPGVKGVYPDMWVTLGLPTAQAKPAPQPPVATKPWGITRVGGGVNYTGTNKAWIIDTGIDLDHPDLNVNSTLSKSFVPRIATAEDDNGHGTHCAGIVAAKDDGKGVIGVAAGAQVVAVKVLDRRGSGAYSVIIAGIDYVFSKAVSGDVVNMSLGGPASDALDDVILTLAGKGVKIALAAGNESQDANKVSPARVNHANVYTISAMGTGDIWASFSNYGNPPVDYCEPGVNIYSTYKGGGYFTMSGTSMAAPHMCGLLLLGAIKTVGTVIGDPDDNADSIGVH